MRPVKYLCLLLAFYLFKSTQAQTFYSVDKNYLQGKTEQNNLTTRFESNYPDSSVTGLSQYAPRNFMGNIGLPSPSYVLGYGTDNLGFRFFNAPLQNDRYYERQVEYYKTKGPYASLTGIAGDKQLQIFRLFYSQSFRKGFNITMRFSRYTSLGYYSKQQTYTNNFYVSSNYATKKNRLGYYLYIMNNGNKNQENGGIKDVVLNDSTALIKKDLFNVRLSSTTRDNREMRVMLNPWYRLNSGSDTSAGLNHFLQLRSTVINATYKYKSANDPADGYYPYIYYDSTKTLDSSHIRQYQNELDYTLKDTHGKFAFSMGYRHEMSKVWQRTDSLITNQVALAELFVSNRQMNPADSVPAKSFDNRIRVQYITQGSNAGNYKFENNFIYRLSEVKKSYLYADMLAESRSADYIYNRWNSNHFWWANNNLKAQQMAEARIGIKLGKIFDVSVFYQNIFRYLFFDQYALPGQYNKTIENIGISAGFSKVFFKHLGISLSNIFQSTSRSAYIRVPQNISTAGLYYHGNLFKNNLQLQLGTQVQLYQSFYGYGYMPETQVFYLQERYATGTYPYLDVYLHARVKPVSIFVKVENALQGLVGANYSFVPGYYQTDRAFRFGITWMFFD